MIALRFEGKCLAVVVFVTVEPEAIFTYDICRYFVYSDIVGERNESLEVMCIVFGGFAAATALNFK